MNPQSFNKYSYCFNNPLKYNDPTGHWPKWSTVLKVAAIVAVAVVVTAAIIVAVPVVLTAVASAASMVAASTSVAAVTTSALAVATATTTAAAAIAPIATAVASIPVLGTVATVTAAVGLECVGLNGKAAINATQQNLNPPGALGNWSPKSFAEGDIIQRVGYPAGNYASPVGQSANASALLPGSEGKPLNIYQFNTSWNALQSTVAPQPQWNRGGMGQQYYF